MPSKYASRARKRVIKRNAKKRRQRRLRTIALRPGFPSEKIVRMRYSQHITLNPGLASYDKYTFRANSIFDPDWSGAGHQPLGHDQWQTFYKNYVVIGSKLTAHILQDVSASEGIIFTGNVDRDTTVSGDYNNVIENGKSRYILRSGTANQSPTVNKFVLKYSPKKFWNVTDLKDNQDHIGANFGNNPTDTAFYNLVLYPLSVATDPATYEILVTIDYLVLCSEALDLATS